MTVAATEVNGPSSMPALPFGALDVAVATDPGREPSKHVNEDAAFARMTVHGHLAVVCDGMGGHVGGKQASNLALETIFRVFDATPPGAPPGELLSHAIREANSAVFARGQASAELKGMGSTCVAVLTHAGGSEVAHVGDSRVYLLTDRQIYQVTKDHSLVQRLVDANMITPEQAANHPNANQITNALGMRADVDVERRAQPFPHAPGDAFVLCSDGLSDECGLPDLLAVLAPLPPTTLAAQQLVDLANARGGHDNITVVIVRLPGGAAFEPPPIAAPGSLTPQPYPASKGSSVPTTTMEMAAAVAPMVAPPFVAPMPVALRTPIDSPTKKKRSLALPIAIVVVLLLVAAAIAVAVFEENEHRTESKRSGKSASAHDDDDSTTTSAPKKKKVRPLDVAPVSPRDDDREAPTPPSDSPHSGSTPASPSRAEKSGLPALPAPSTVPMPPIDSPAAIPSDLMKSGATRLPTPPATPSPPPIPAATTK